MKVHFTGIKGVGMAALALAYQDAGWEVTGSDTKDWQITDPVLAERGIEVSERFTPRNIWVLKKMVWVPAIDKLIHTGAHHGAQNVEAKWAASRGVPTLNYAKALGEFFTDKKQIVVCGVGGKTTTAAMIATILYDVLPDPSWIIGTSEIGSLPFPGRMGNGEWTVIEGDEYSADPAADKTPKFTYLTPKIIICTNIHHDHPDVYPTEKDTIQAYSRFFEKLPKDGILLMSSQASSVIPAKAGIYLDRSRLKPGMTRNGPGMTIYDQDRELRELVQGVIQVPGDYNVRNAMAAVLAAEYIGVTRKKALEALKKYTGSKRRFELIADVGGVKLYDDYAHHPIEIKALAAAARQKFPDRRIRFVFQPHTFSRTKALFEDFADSLKTADEVIMFPIFASAREKKDETVGSQMLAEEIRKRGAKAVFIKTAPKLVEYLVRTAADNEVIFTVGAGNLYEIHQDLLAGLEKKRAAV